MNRLTPQLRHLLLIVSATIYALFCTRQGFAFQNGELADVRGVLAAKTDLSLSSMSIRDFTSFLAKKHNISIRVDETGLKRAGVTLDKKVSGAFMQRPLGAALSEILRPAKLRYLVRGRAIWITDLQSLRPPVERVGPNAMLGEAFRRPAAVGFANPLVRNRQENVAQLRTLVQIEFRLVTTICRPTKEQLAKLKGERDRIINEVMQETNGQNQPDRLLQQLLPHLEARQVLEREVATSARSVISAEMAARYLGEAQKRDTNQRQVQARNLVVTLDQELSLSPEQRQRLVAVLSSNWRDDWASVVMLSATGNAYVPAIPSELIEPHLEPAQFDVWQNLTKIGRVSGQHGMVMQNLDDDE